MKFDDFYAKLKEIKNFFTKKFTDKSGKVTANIDGELEVENITVKITMTKDWGKDAIDEAKETNNMKVSGNTIIIEASGEAESILKKLDNTFGKWYNNVAYRLKPK